MSAVNYSLSTSNMPDPQVPDEAHPVDLTGLRPLPRISIHAFCESEQMLRTMEQMGRDRRMAKVNMRVTNGGTEAAANMFSGSPTPNLIILETDVQPSGLLAELAPLADVCDPSTRVIVVGRYNDIALYRELIRNGISEYLVGPVQMVEILSSIAAIFVDPEAEPVGKSIAFVGGEGRRWFLHHRSQLRFRHLHPLFHRDDPGRLGPPLWYGEYRFRSGSGTRDRGSCFCA
jgi:pilus assembly protein CpaE